MRKARRDPQTTTPGGDAADPRKTRVSVNHGLLGELGEAADMIAFKHSVFALPFAVMSLITAAGDGWPSAGTWAWVVIAMISARTAAMSFNRLADHELDTFNPRTADRSLPAGRLSRRFVWRVTVIAALAFMGAAAMLNRLCLVLAVPTLGVLFGYSYAKRWTAAAHLWLGLSLGIAPIGAWIAVTGAIEPPPLMLGAAVMFWVAGFDIIYSLQDESFDRSHSLRSIPAAIGPRAALRIARFFHVLALAGFAAFAAAAGGGWLRFAAVATAAVLMGWQHRLVRADDLSAVDAAFFTANGLLSVAMCSLFVIARLVP
jgi:4-hydroxybenzoate polyprenyltransferase